MLTLNKPPCFYDISAQVSVTDVEERTTFHGSGDKMVEREGAEQR